MCDVRSGIAKKRSVGKHAACCGCTCHCRCKFEQARRKCSKQPDDCSTVLFPGQVLPELQFAHLDQRTITHWPSQDVSKKPALSSTAENTKRRDLPALCGPLMWLSPLRMIKAQFQGVYLRVRCGFALMCGACKSAATALGSCDWKRGCLKMGRIPQRTGLPSVPSDYPRKGTLKKEDKSKQQLHKKRLAA